MKNIYIYLGIENGNIYDGFSYGYLFFNSKFMANAFQNTEISAFIQPTPKTEKSGRTIRMLCPCILCVKIGVTFILVFGSQLVETILFDMDVGKQDIGIL